MILRVRPNQQCHSTEGRWLVNHVKGQSHQAQLTKGKEKNVIKKKFSIYIAPLRPKTERRLEDRELNQARSKPDTVNRPVRTARTFVHHYNSTQYCFSQSSEDASLQTLLSVTPSSVFVVPVKWLVIIGHVNRSFYLRLLTYCYTETVFIYSSLPRDQHHI